MAVFRPTAVRQGLMDLTPEFLTGLGARALLLDIDNTVASYTSHEPIPGAVEWAKRMVDAGFRVLVVSNNFKKRVRAFSSKLGLDCISFAMKPFPFGYLKARRLLRMKCAECVIVGDQIFTDVVGANLCGMKSVLLTPIEEEEGFSFRARRYFEKPLRKKFQKRRDIL